MSRQTVTRFSAAWLKRFPVGFEAIVEASGNLILTHPWIDQVLAADKARPTNERVFWKRPNLDDNDPEPCVPSIVFFNDLFPSVAHDLLDPTVDCLVKYLDDKGRTVGRGSFKRWFNYDGSGKAKVRLQCIAGKWHMITYCGDGMSVPAHTASLAICIEHTANGCRYCEPYITIPVVRDVRDEFETDRYPPRLRGRR